MKKNYFKHTVLAAIIFPYTLFASDIGESLEKRYGTATSTIKQINKLREKQNLSIADLYHTLISHNFLENKYTVNDLKKKKEKPALLNSPLRILDETDLNTLIESFVLNLECLDLNERSKVYKNMLDFERELQHLCPKIPSILRENKIRDVFTDIVPDIDAFYVNLDQFDLINGVEMVLIKGNYYHFHHDKKRNIFKVCDEINGQLEYFNLVIVDLKLIRSL